jgi:hypothetical protein
MILFRVTAAQVTDAQGHRSTRSGLFISELRTQPVGYKTETVWSVNIKLRQTTLGNLTGHRMFDLLAKHLFNLGYNLHTKVEYGSSERVHAICVQDKEFRAKGHSIYER